MSKVHNRYKRNNSFYLKTKNVFSIKFDVHGSSGARVWYNQVAEIFCLASKSWKDIQRHRSKVCANTLTIVTSTVAVLETSVCSRDYAKIYTDDLLLTGLRAVKLEKEEPNKFCCRSFQHSEELLVAWSAQTVAPDWNFRRMLNVKCVREHPVVKTRPRNFLEKP